MRHLLGCCPDGLNAALASGSHNGNQRDQYSSMAALGEGVLRSAPLSLSEYLDALRSRVATDAALFWSSGPGGIGMCASYTEPVPIPPTQRCTSCTPH